jgi:hypothetical protein
VGLVTAPSPAKNAYEAYAESTGGLTFDGRKMPTWNDLPERIRNAWEAAARAAREFSAPDTLPRIVDVDELFCKVSG